MPGLTSACRSLAVPGPLGDLLGSRAGPGPPARAGRVFRPSPDVDGERHRRGLEVRGQRGQVLVLFSIGTFPSASATLNVATLSV